MKSFHVAFSVPDIDAILEKLTKAGAEFVAYVKPSSKRDGVLNLRIHGGYQYSLFRELNPY